MSYRLSERADRDLDQILYQGLIRFGESQALAYYDALIEFLGVLATMPEAYRNRMEFKHPIRVAPFRQHVVIYDLDDEQITILTIRHGSENWQADYG